MSAAWEKGHCMLNKTWDPKSERFDVTFDLPAELDIEQAHLVGEFNDWDESAQPLTRQDDGSWATTVALEPGRTYRFRYHLGGDRWENDWNADDYLDNDFGGSDSVVEVPEAPTPPPPATGKGKQEGATAPAKKAAAKKATANKGTAKKAAAKKATSEKGTAKKAAAKKGTAKKATAEKTAAKKATAEKGAAKKATAKKGTAKKASKKAT